MKTNRIITVAVMSAAVIALGSAKADESVAKLGKMEIVSVNKMVIGTTNDDYVLRVGLTFQNGNAESMKLRNGVFQTQVTSRHTVNGTNTEVSVDIGQGALSELELAGTGNKKANGVTTAEVVVNLGPRSGGTVQKLIDLWNILGNAENQISLNLKGSAEMGQELGKGWVFEQGKAYEVDLPFEPKLERKVLFQ